MDEGALRTELKRAMRGKEQLRVNVLRSVLAAIKNRVIEKKGQALSESEIAALIKKEAKQCGETLDFARQGERIELVKEQERILAVLESLLPAQLTEDELKTAIDGIITATGASSLGEVMKELGLRHGGRFDGKTAAGLAREALTDR